MKLAKHAPESPIEKKKLIVEPLANILIIKKVYANNKTRRIIWIILTWIIFLYWMYKRGLLKLLKNFLRNEIKFYNVF